MMTRKALKRFIDNATLTMSLISTLAMIDILLTKFMPINMSVLIAIVTGALYVVFARIKSEYEYWEKKNNKQE